MTQNASFQPQVCEFFLPLFNLLFLFFFLGSIHVLKQRGGFSWAAMRKTGPNDTFGPQVCGFFSFMFYLFYLFYLGSICVLKRWAGLGWVAMRKMGPNDMFCVVWAIGMWFFSFIFFLFFFRFYLCSKTTDRVGLGGDEKNGPKRRKTRCLGHRYVSFLLLMFFMY